MKVSVITRHAIANYGSLLQAFATQKILEKLGYESEIIDYIRDDESYKQHEKTLLKRKEEWNNNPIKRATYLLMRQPESVKAGKRFEKERKELLNLSERYTNPNALKDNPPAADIYMTGSDQVWGPVANGTYDDSYCLSFAKGKKVAFAASFGHTEMTEDLKDYYKKWLTQYNSIAVREDSAVEILKDLGINSSQVLDPTLLLGKEYWKEFFLPIKKKKYVLAYQLHNDKKLGEYAKKVAKAKGLPLIRVSASFHQITREGKFKWCPKLGEFLSYVNDAECVITDSFHATAFAINFNTPFVEVLPNNKTGTRNMSILNLTKLTDRVLKDFNDTNLADKEIDFSYANSVIEEQRKQSIDTLKEMLES
ncbi:MAG: polysaccharide pyruvyl transferase family protein [Eubacterium sp.]|nr:polysaccharide pyruvyl transferase family protein [Eubacterium sp.]